MCTLAAGSAVWFRHAGLLLQYEALVGNDVTEAHLALVSKAISATALVTLSVGFLMFVAAIGALVSIPSSE
jgi:hypothetical protein